jgi:hypothetical protein
MSAFGFVGHAEVVADERDGKFRGDAGDHVVVGDVASACGVSPRVRSSPDPQRMPIR